ncbi:MAG TPA: cysteine--tRNA ligase [Pirellulales bacterium]|nr:cysteine--tRNA ligase [Pirellulales bacterium]
MPIRVYNTLSKTKEPFEPVSPGRAGIYLCGPTVYKPSHIGHMVGPVIFDAIKRYLVYCGYQVTLVVNITDVDDKLIAESQKRGMPMSALAEEMTADYHRNLAAMGIDTIDHFPKATDHIGAIIDFCRQLIDRGFAYESEGDVYFQVDRDPEYGKLSHRDVAALQGEGGGTAERKRSAADFALWKSAKPGEPSWDSPWGKGRPGWHIECSAMSHRLLGETFDIHGGGLDLVFPHHENEIAQSECCHGKPQAKYWLHNGLMQASNEVGKVGGRNTRDLAAGDQAAQEAGKMGKSKGASPFRELLEKYAGETIRFFLLSTHYRRPIDFSEERIEEVEKGLDTFYRFFKRYERIAGESYYQVAAATTREQGAFEPGENAMQRQFHELREQFLEAMDDDFNTGGGIGVLFELVRALNKFADDSALEAAGKSDAEKRATFKLGASIMRELAGTIGLFLKPVETAASGGDELVNQLMALVIEMRADARKSKNFAMADKIRDRLGEIGITLEDRPSGTEWTRQ